jgi:polar amino acid transport system permease protein
LKRLFLTEEEQSAHPMAVLFNYLLVSVAVVVFFWFSLSRIGVTFDFSFIGKYQVRIWDGFVMTVQLSIVSLLISLAIGVCCAVGQNSRILFLRSLCTVYVQFIRGTPLIMQIYLFFYIVGTAWGIDNRFWAGVLILSIFEGAYIAEIVRGSILSFDVSQLEAAKAVGFTPQQTFSAVVLPQLIERTLPALTGQFASIIKDSSLLSMIAVIELMQTMREISATNFKLFECYIFLGVLYLCLTLPISLASKTLERRFRYEN